MSFKHHVYPEGSIGVIRLSGVVSADEILSAIRDLYTDERWEPGFGTLWDSRDVRQLVILPEDLPGIRRTSSELIARQGMGKIAVVASRDLDYQIAKLVLMQRQVPIREAAVFRSLTEALAWLGVQDHPPGLVAAS